MADQRSLPESAALAALISIAEDPEVDVDTRVHAASRILDHEGPQWQLEMVGED